MSFSTKKISSQLDRGAFFPLLEALKQNSTLQLWSKQEQVPKADADGMRLCSIELRFSELVKNEKSLALNWSEVSLWWKQIDRESRWIQSWLIRWILWDSRALPNTAHPLLLNPHPIPTQSRQILPSHPGGKSQTYRMLCNVHDENTTFMYEV